MVAPIGAAGAGLIVRLTDDEVALMQLVDTVRQITEMVPVTAVPLKPEVEITSELPTTVARLVSVDGIVNTAVTLELGVQPDPMVSELPDPPSQTTRFGNTPCVVVGTGLPGNELTVTANVSVVKLAQPATFVQTIE